MTRRLPLLTSVAGLLLGCSAGEAAQPPPAAPAVDLPHSYYYREMYLPQLTSGPSSLAWSPDSRELVYPIADDR